MDTPQDWGERFARLALAIDEHLPGYLDSYFGPAEWQTQSKQAGKILLPDLSKQVDQFANDISRAEDMDAQRKDYLSRHVTAMQMSLRLLSGEKITLAEEALALYDIQPAWKDESRFEEAQREYDELLPSGDSLQERLTAWKKSLEVPVEKVSELIPRITDKLRLLTRKKFDLPEDESFVVEFVSNEPWSAYNWYLGNSKSRIDINTDIPTRISFLPAVLAHEGYPGHHTDLSIKEKKLVQKRKYYEFTANLLNAPSAVMAEGIATTALRTVLSDHELEEWFREELLPVANMTDIDPKRIIAMSNAANKMDGLAGNAAFMLHDQQKSEAEITRYLQRYGLSTEKEAKQTIRFISDPLSRSYIFTYHIGYDLLEELFAGGNWDAYFKRLLEEPVTPTLVQQWIQDQGNHTAREAPM